MKLAAWDYETHLISEEMLAPKPVCISYWDSEGNKGIVTGFEAMETWLLGFLSDFNTLKIAHNFTFEFLVTYVWYPSLRPLLWENLDRGLFFCTQLHQQLLNNVSKDAFQGTSLANLVEKYLKLDISAGKSEPDAWRLRYAELEGVHLKDWPKEAYDYSLSDSDYALQVYHHLIKQDESILQLEHLKASVTLGLIAIRGILIDENKVKVLDKEITEALAPAYQHLQDLGFIKFDAKTGKYKKKVKELKAYIEEHFKDRVIKTRSGGVSTSGESLEEYLLKDPEDEVLLAFNYIAKYEKIKSAFISRLETANPYMYTQYRAIVRSGRTSSSASSFYPSLNIQQVPRGI